MGNRVDTRTSRAYTAGVCGSETGPAVHGGEPEYEKDTASITCSAMMLSARSTYSDHGRCGVVINGLHKLNTAKLNQLTGLVADDAEGGAGGIEHASLDTARVQCVLSTMQAAEATAIVNTMEDRGGTPGSANTMGAAL